MSLKFSDLRTANVIRLPQFRNAKGELCHLPDGSDWSPSQWGQAVTGEWGEYANVRKKFERGDMSEDEFKIAAGKELADVITYLDILAFRLGIDLGDAVIQKFNEVTERVSADIYLTPEGPCRFEMSDLHPIKLDSNTREG
jgi:NTP pyrophosphatase (non-canonical NTP hydrolase)